MFPIRDSIPTRRFPLVNCGLIVANILVFLFQLSLGQEGQEALFMEFGLIPDEFSGTGEKEGLFAYTPFLSNLFLHGGWMHLIGNVWTLYIFGDNVEDRMGRGAYLAFYLLAGIGANLTHLFFNWGSPVPTIGASGAISGVMGAYMLLYPKSRIQMLIPIFYIPFFFRIPAFLYLAYWFVLQLFNGTQEMAANDATGGIAFWAHIGGFVVGLILYRIFLDRQYQAPSESKTYKQRPKHIEDRPWTNYDEF
ncbi:MAG: rhomboid family intramembrane serine protease [Bacteroidota bacterium]